MTFNARETSADLGAPFELFEFTRGVNRWRYAGGDRSIVWLANTYEAAAIVRGPIEAGQELTRAGIRITAQRDLAIVDQYRVTAPSDPILVTVFGSHDGDPDAEFVVVWQGRIMSANWQPDAVDLNCESVFTSMRRVGLRRAFQRTCPHVLYGSECKASKTSFQTNATLSGVAGAVISSAAFATPGAGYFLGGMVEYTTPQSVVERRHIVAHGTADVTMERPLPGLVAGAAVAIFPGCDHTKGAAGCARFANVLNYGGMDYIPQKNPFGGDPIY